jgi:hypothetical protein
MPDRAGSKNRRWRHIKEIALRPSIDEIALRSIVVIYTASPPGIALAMSGGYCLKWTRHGLATSLSTTDRIEYVNLGEVLLWENAIMRKKMLTIALVLFALAIPVGMAEALRIAPPPGPVRIVNSDAVFVGRVTGIEPMDVEAKAFPGSKEMVKYRIAVVKVNQIINGLKDEKEVRVGFVPFVAPKGRPIIGGRGNPQLEVGQEGIFMISKHHDGKFYQAPNFGYFVPAAQKNFDDEIKTAKKVVAVMGDTKKVLQSKDADERLLAALIVVSKYRTQKPPFSNKEEPIDAEESKLILNAIANAKWQQVKFGEPDPLNLFFQLGINEKDGWMFPKQNTPENLRNAVQAWIRDHGEYRVKRFVEAQPK